MQWNDTSRYSIFKGICIFVIALNTLETEHKIAADDIAEELEPDACHAFRRLGRMALSYKDEQLDAFDGESEHDLSQYQTCQDRVMLKKG